MPNLAMLITLPYAPCFNICQVYTWIMALGISHGLQPKQTMNDFDKSKLEDISRRLIKIQSACDKARSGINKVLEETASLLIIVQQEISLSDETGHLDADIISSNVVSESDKSTVLDLMQRMSKENGNLSSVDSVLYRAEEMGIEQTRTKEIIDCLRRDGDVFEPRPGMLKLP